MGLLDFGRGRRPEYRQRPTRLQIRHVRHQAPSGSDQKTFDMVLGRHCGGSIFSFEFLNDFGELIDWYGFASLFARLQTERASHLWMSIYVMAATDAPQRETRTPRRVFGGTR